MKKIGEGVQYDVFDLGNNRVRKVKTSFFQKMVRLHRIARKYKIYIHPYHNIKMAIETDRITKKSISGLKERIQKIDQALIGNPEILNDSDYEQDKVRSLGEELYSSDSAKVEDLINKYISNILTGWDYGFSDTVFNFMINAGVTREGEVILTDLGELTYNKDDVDKLVSTKHWEKRSSFNKLNNSELKNYIRSRFDAEVTIANLNIRWGSKATKAN